jgi:[ribosomal protein S18]-alanine N-acetyltransferase
MEYEQKKESSGTDVFNLIRDMESLCALQADLEQYKEKLVREEEREESLYEQLKSCDHRQRELRETIADETANCENARLELRRRIIALLHTCGISAEEVDDALSHAIHGHKHELLCILKQANSRITPTKNSPTTSGALKTATLMKPHEMIRLKRFAAAAEEVERTAEEGEPPAVRGLFSTFQFRKAITDAVLPASVRKASDLLAMYPSYSNDKAVLQHVALCAGHVQQEISQVILPNTLPQKRPLLITPHIRWMIRRDMSEVLAIENTSFDNPWTEEEFIAALRQRNCIGKVVEWEEEVVGFMLYELYKRSLRPISLAVRADFRLLGFGEALVMSLHGKLSIARRRRIRTVIHETNLQGAQFFSACGFDAQCMVPQPFEGTDDNGISMVLEYASPTPTGSLQDQEWLKQAEAFLSEVA